MISEGSVPVGDGYYADLTIDPNSTFDLREMAINIDEAARRPYSG